MVHQGLGGEIPELGITLYLMQWGQLTDHDIVLTPIETGESKPQVEMAIFSTLFFFSFFFFFFSEKSLRLAVCVG